jgi:hypothetical protein
MSRRVSGDLDRGLAPHIREDQLELSDRDGRKPRITAQGGDHAINIAIGNLIGDVDVQSIEDHPRIVKRLHDAIGRECGFGHARPPSMSE